MSSSQEKKDIKTYYCECGKYIVIINSREYSLQHDDHCVKIRKCEYCNRRIDLPNNHSSFCVFNKANYI